MASYSKFQSENAKTTKMTSRDNYNPAFNAAVEAKGMAKEGTFHKNLDKYVDLVSFYRWNPDLWFDLITPETGSIRLDLDQRVFLRCMARFFSTYAVFPRGYGKTMKEVMAMYHAAIFFPDIQLTMTAQTRENAAKILEEKHRELIKFYPMLKDEIYSARFSKDSAEIIFTSGGRVDVMANHQSSKGARRHREQIEESALLNNVLFEDVLEPIVNTPRRTIGKRACVAPEELNGQINFLTTPGFKGSDEYHRSIRMIKSMGNLEGQIVLGSSWHLGCYYGRGETKSQLIDKKTKLSPIFFAMNYGGIWSGSVENQLIDINKMMQIRTLTKAKIVGDKDKEYVLGVDVARSADTANNQSSVSVLELRRNSQKRITNINLVNLFNISNALNFTGQAIEIKKIQKSFNAKAVICDSNGLGIGLIDELMKDTIDPNTGESLGCWDTMNTDMRPEVSGSPRILYDLKVQGVNSETIVAFIDMVDSGKLRILEKRANTDYSLTDKDNFEENVLPFVQTDFLLEEIANLQLEHLASNKLTLKRVVKKYNKDRYSALSYGLWYIKTFEDNQYGQIEDEFEYLKQYTFV